MSELYDAGIVRTPVDIMRLRSRTVPAAADVENPAEEEAGNDAGNGARNGKTRTKRESVVVESTLEGREGWGRQSARNVFEAIEKAKDVTLGR